MAEIFTLLADSIVPALLHLTGVIEGPGVKGGVMGSLFTCEWVGQREKSDS